MSIEPVEITPQALKAVEDIMAKKAIPEGYGLRIYLADKGISCGATNYQVGFDHATDSDITYSKGKLKVIIKKVEAVHLSGLTLDYITQENLSGFSFSRDN